MQNQIIDLISNCMHPTYKVTEKGYIIQQSLLALIGKWKSWYLDC